jgi:hypothetical protein
MKKTVSKKSKTFASAKTLGVISYNQRWHRDALIQLTLDNRIFSIEGKNSACSSNCPACRQLQLDIWGKKIDVSLSHPNKSGCECGSVFEHLVLTRDLFLQEPQRENSLMIWRYRNIEILKSDEHSLLNLFNNQEKPIQISNVLLLEGLSRDPIEIAFKLICVSKIGVSLQETIAPETQLSLGAGICQLNQLPTFSKFET